MINPTATTCMEMSSEIPNREHAIGIRRSALTAFFTRSSAANIPVNMKVCEEMGLDRDTYSVTIPLGATINMDGAAITITVMTMATATSARTFFVILSAARKASPRRTAHIRIPT